MPSERPAAGDVDPGPARRPRRAAAGEVRPPGSRDAQPARDRPHAGGAVDAAGPQGPDEASLQRRRERKARRRRWLRLVRMGLTLVLAALGLTIVVLLAAFVFGWLIAFEAFSEETAGHIRRWLAVAFITANVLSIAGRACCLVVPRQSRARELIYGAVGLDLVSAGLNACLFAGVLPRWLGPLAGLAAVAGLVLFVLFLFRLAVSLKLSEPAKEAETLLGWGVWLVIFLAVLEYVLPSIPLLGWAVAFFLAIGVQIMLLVMVVRYAGLLWWMRSSMG